MLLSFPEGEGTKDEALAEFGENKLGEKKIARKAMAKRTETKEILTKIARGGKNEGL